MGGVATRKDRQKVGRGGGGYSKRRRGAIVLTATEDTHSLTHSLTHSKVGQCAAPAPHLVSVPSAPNQLTLSHSLTHRDEASESVRPYI